MAYQDILYDVSDAVATVTLNRPDRLNAWTGRMGEEVKDAFDSAAGDDAVRAIILTGAGRGFCAGADMELLTGIQNADEEERNRQGSRPDRRNTDGEMAEHQGLFSYFITTPKPVIAAINGPAAGMGFILPLYCDMRFAADNAIFTTAFSRRGLIAEHGISWLLPHQVGTHRALDLLLSARKVDAKEAYEIGLVNGVYPAESFMDDVRAYAADLATNVSPRSMRVMKRQVYGAQYQSLTEAVETANDEMVQSFPSEDFKEGVASFMEKRAPNFTGR